MTRSSGSMLPLAASISASFSRDPTLGEVTALADMMADMGKGEGEEGLTAVGWALLNRYGGAEEAASVGRPLPLERRCGADFCRVLGLAARILAGEVPDPTRGATRFHAHDELPAWAEERMPCALIGGHLFYAV
ncbi:hypothetical protein [Parvibaculum sp. MBR-TMA-1.3b-4.2]